MSEGGGGKPDAGAWSGRHEVVVSYDSMATAERVSGNPLRKIKGTRPANAFMTVDGKGRRWVYVSVAYSGYAKLCGRVHGGRLSDDGLDADHVASKAVEGAFGQRYVLMARVDPGANSSHGASFERPGATVERPFNFHALAPARAGKEGRASVLSVRAGEKVAGVKKADIDTAKAVRTGGRTPEDKRVAWATFQDKGSQDRLAAMDNGTFSARDIVEREAGNASRSPAKTVEPPPSGKVPRWPSSGSKSVGARGKDIGHER